MFASPSRLRPRPSMMPRKNFWSTGTSSSAARAAAGTSTAAAPSASPRATPALKTVVLRLCLVFIRTRTLEPLNCRDCCGRSGRFCGAIRCQRLIQQANNPGNDGYIGQVKNIPIELPIRRRNVEKDEIGDPSIGQTVYGVAKGSADDQAQREGGEPVFGARKPDPEQQHGDRLE